MDLMPIPDFAAGAMENWGCVTFREVDLMIDEHLAPWPNQAPRGAGGVARDRAHGDRTIMG